MATRAASLGTGSPSVREGNRAPAACTSPTWSQNASSADCPLHAASVAATASAATAAAIDGFRRPRCLLKWL